MISLDDINKMDESTFAATFGHVAEHSPWVAREAHSLGPFADRQALIKAFEAGMRGAPHDAQLALVRAHPDLAGKAALAGKLEEASRTEQAGAGLDRLTAEELARFTQLNGAYLERFGFPFIFAVKGADKHMILSAFEERLQNSVEAEFEIALVQISRIFRFRLEDMVP
ncbi:2-oxo-4-hydroxy-4-carboxy-5-ureidoimidazoline decarboxylase [Roseibium suaedae]|uniref:2-oxo-4-hydroxy-4-carboxy-5-ureidoimidazoline decarboxylase n=1 Tax=Roseibium suaedae TaxID=735517 RepID=A0A1M7PMZ3_9HYPH|nr:2-oxo-4-hydroxy-4-carboxy-5-ureidoimidazoline decarboxylase [Roseibium suaedae]SHN18685.1 2-oxo-4-hydroxy-4-carboxy-5-ureidoimidazoline decarboxylase [Roseibium suaedae]